MKLFTYLKENAVLCIALVLAALSCVFMQPGLALFGYIDYRVLVLLLSLMLIVAGFNSLGVFQMLGEILCTKVHRIRTLKLVLVLLCFFLSMLVTNDVALITFVPFTLLVFSLIHCEDELIHTVVLETIAANLGSMLTPIGNPQNLLLYSLSGMSIGQFILHMLPLTLLSLVGLVFCIITTKNKSVAVGGLSCTDRTDFLKNKKFWIYCILFCICLGNIFHLYSYLVVGIIVGIVVLLIQPSLYKNADYGLLLTFIGFFIFVGNIRQIEWLQQWISGAVTGRELLSGVAISQVISNVPAAMLLSGFTSDYRSLLYGVNIGGLGTLIASMASLISYQAYTRKYPACKGKYLAQFTLYNLGFLAVLFAFTVIL